MKAVASEEQQKEANLKEALEEQLAQVNVASFIILKSTLQRKPHSYKKDYLFRKFLLDMFNNGEFMRLKTKGSYGLAIFISYKFVHISAP